MSEGTGRMSANRAAARRLNSDSDSDAEASTSPQMRSRGEQRSATTRVSSFVPSTRALGSSMPRMATAEEIVGGAGAFVEEQEGAFWILGLVPGGPAEQSAQILVGDQLVGIDKFKTWYTLPKLSHASLQCSLCLVESGI